MNRPGTHRSRTHHSRTHCSKTHRSRIHSSRTHCSRTHRSRAHRSRAHRSRVHRPRAHRWPTLNLIKMLHVLEVLNLLDRPMTHRWPTGPCFSLPLCPSSSPFLFPLVLSSSLPLSSARRDATRGEFLCPWEAFCY